MSELIEASDGFTFEVPKFGTKRLYAWRTAAGVPFGWICARYDINCEIPGDVLPEHRLLYDGIGAIEQRPGAVNFNLPLGCVELFCVPSSAGLGRLSPGSKANAYLQNAKDVESNSIPEPGEFVVFGSEANGDLWTYTPVDKCVFHMVFGCEPISRAGVLRQVKETPVLFRVKGGETFTAFVEFFAARHLAKLN
jgi:hypothetical protein